MRGLRPPRARAARRAARAEQALGREEAGARGSAVAPRRRVQRARRAARRARGARRGSSRRRSAAVDGAGLEQREVGPRRARRCGARRPAASPASVGAQDRLRPRTSGSASTTTRRAASSGARRRRSGSPGSVKLQPTISCRPRADERVLGAAAQRAGSVLSRPAPPRRVGQRGGQLLEAVHARDLLDQVGLAGDVVAPQVRDRHVEAVRRASLDAEPERAQDLRLARGAGSACRASPARACSRRRMTAGGGPSPPTSIVPGASARAGQLDHQPRGHGLRPAAPARARGPSRSAR